MTVSDPWAAFPDASGKSSSSSSKTADPWSAFPNANPDANTASSADYGNMSWSEVVDKGVHNFIPSAENSLTSIPRALYNYKQTAGALGQIGTGAVSKVQGLYENQDPQEKAKNEAAFNALVAPYTSVAGFKQALAEDPFSVLTTAAIPLSGGAGLLGKGAEMLGEASTAGRVAGAASNLVGGAANLADPVRLAKYGAQNIPGWTGKAITGAQSFATGKPQTAFQTAAKAGFEGGDLADSFNTFAKGQGDPVDLSRTVHSAVQGMKSDAMSDWASQKGNLMAQAQPVPLTPIWQAIQDERNKLSPLSVAGPPAQAAHKALNDAEGMVWDRAMSGDPADVSLQGIDQLKQELREMYAGQYKGQMAENSLKGVHAGARKALSDASPSYDNLMGGYQRILDDLQDVTKSAGASDKTAATTQLSRLVRAQKTPEGQTLIERLGERDPHIPFMLAGAALHDSLASGASGLAEKGSGLFHVWNIGRSLMRGDPSEIGSALALPVIQGTVQSPRVMGATNYLAGKAAGAVAPVAKPVGKVLNVMTAPGVNAAATNLSRVEQAHPQPGYAKGGAVHDKAKHERCVNRLMILAEKAKKAHKEATKPLLRVPDDAITTALAKANEAI